MPPKKKTYGDPVYCWGFLSSQPRGGQFITYETRLEEDGSLRCNCPGWVFAKKGQERGCKHTREVKEEAPGLLRDWKAGKTLPTQTPTTQQMTRLLQSKGVKVALEDHSRIRYGRIIDMD